MSCYSTKELAEIITNAEKTGQDKLPVNKIVRKPRTRHCWHCMSKFQGNHFAILWIDGAKRELHKACRDLIKLGEFPEYNLEAL